jgi:hypothetical protein
MIVGATGKKRESFIYFQKRLEKQTLLLSSLPSCQKKKVFMNSVIVQITWTGWKEHSTI